MVPGRGIAKAPYFPAQYEQDGGTALKPGPEEGPASTAPTTTTIIQSAWTMTWVPEGEPEVTESATGHGTGSENVAAADGWSGSMA